MGGSHQLHQRNVKPFYDNPPQPRCLPIRTLGRNRPTFDHLLPFGTVGYLRRLKPEHKLAPRGAQCILLGIDTNYPRRTFRVRDLTTGQVIMRQATIWYPTADAGEAVSRNAMTRGGGGGARHGHYLPRPKKTCHYTSSLGSREAISEEPESEQHEPGGVGPKMLLRVKEWSMKGGRF